MGQRKKILDVGDSLNKNENVLGTVERFVERRIDYFIWSLILLCLTLIFFFIKSSAWLSSEYKSNFIAEIFGVAFTIIFLILLLDLKEEYKWRKVRDTVFRLLRSDLNNVYTHLSMFLECMTVLSGGGITREDLRETLRNDFYNKLKERSEDLVLDKEAHKLALDHSYDDIFRFTGERIDRFEMKYSRYLDPSFTKSLILIGDGLYGLEFTIEIYKKNKDSKSFESSFKFHASRVIKELYELHSESNFDFFHDIPSEKDDSN